MRPDDRSRLLHMIEAAEAVQEFTVGRVAADLSSDRMLLFAVLRAIEVLGEAASKLLLKPAQRPAQSPGSRLLPRETG